MSKPRLAAAACALALSVGLVGAPPARAQFAVVDVKAILQAEQQVSNQLTAIQRLESQLSNQALMLQKMQTDITGPIAAIAGQATGILQKAEGIGYGAQDIAGQYAKLYPQTMSGASLATTQGSLQQWRNTNSAALQDAMNVQNLVAQGQPGIASGVSDAVRASQAAAGQTAAVQATNQLLATVSAQLTQLQNLLITQARAEQTLAAQAQASQATGAADSQRFWAVTAPGSRVQNPGSL